jgi:hypothetical protein
MHLLLVGFDFKLRQVVKGPDQELERCLGSCFEPFERVDLGPVGVNLLGLLGGPLFQHHCVSPVSFTPENEDMQVPHVFLNELSCHVPPDVDRFALDHLMLRKL